MGFRCTRCGAWHEDLPLAYATDAPAVWSAEAAAYEGSELGEETCVIGGEHFFVRGRLVLPVRDAEADFEWGVWVSLSRASFERTLALWRREEREAEPPYFGWLASELPVYEPSTLNLKTSVHTRPVGERPLVELEPTDHPLAVQQREGIEMATVQAFAEALVHVS